MTSGAYRSRGVGWPSVWTGWRTLSCQPKMLPFCQAYKPLFRFKLTRLPTSNAKCAKLELILDGLKTKRFSWKKRSKPAKRNGRKVAEWPATHKLQLKRAELAKAQDKVDAFVDKHGSIEDLGNEIEELQVAQYRSSGLRADQLQKEVSRRAQGHCC